MTQEAIGGYFLVLADSLDAAVEIARECPTVEFGCTVEVRPVAEACAQLDKAKAQLAEATA